MQGNSEGEVEEITETIKNKTREAEGKAEETRRWWGRLRDQLEAVKEQGVFVRKLEGRYKIGVK